MFFGSSGGIFSSIGTSSSIMGGNHWGFCGYIGRGSPAAY